MVKLDAKSVVDTLARVEEGAWLNRALNVGGLRMRGMQLQHFELAGDADGVPWPLRKAMVVKGKYHPLLVLTARLRNSIKHRGYRDTAGNAIIEVFTNVVYAPAHQFGTETIPRRQFMYLRPSERQSLLNIYADMLRRALASKTASYGAGGIRNGN